MRNTFIYASPERAGQVVPAAPDRVLRAGITGGTAIDTETRETGPVEVDLSGVAALRYVLRVRGFRRLWMVLGVASLGDWIGLLATALFASSQVSSRAPKGAPFGGAIAVPLLSSLA